MTNQIDPAVYFRMKPVKAARVSEISESTAAASIPDSELINFHIGNPLQDPRLSSAFLRIALGIDVHQAGLRDTEPDAILEHLGWGASDRPKLEFIIRTIRKSSPYLPRGGYSRKAPHALIQKFRAWLEQQQEPLVYDTGEQSGRREIILASGGVHEAMRVILFALSSYLEKLPARILCYQCNLIPAEKAIPGLLFEDLDAEERLAYDQIDQFLSQEPEVPVFILIGKLLSEETRYKLRLLSVKRPIFFIEANNAPNHLSLAREAKLSQRVIRLLTPAIFSPRMQVLSTVMIAGNADLLSVIENVHFGMKGTPSASEVEFLLYLLEGQLTNPVSEFPDNVPEIKPAFEGLALGIDAETVLPRLAERVERHLERLLADHTEMLADTASTLDEKASALGHRIQSIWRGGIFDEFISFPVKDLLEQLANSYHETGWSQALQRSFLAAFIKHQPQYRADACLVASGSSRTALGIIGFHCGITEVVIPDLSWSYEQCFPKVYPVPLTASLELDTPAMIAKLADLCRSDPTWPDRGAVAINNPHNATGRIFEEESICELLSYCLQRGIYIIDDLAYQNVAPTDDLVEIKTARQVAAELVQLGRIDEAQADRVITVHSMSKTDCLAGARLAVVEIRDPLIRQRFYDVNSYIQPNIAAIFITYLFYRNSTQAARTYWHLRNSIFRERTQALLTAAENLPPDRNPFGLTIIPPAGSMYPLLHIERLPPGLSLDWLASSLARNGIGLLPLATFARTEEGFETGRSTFRLTLGGVDPAETLLIKTRRLLIYLNRLIAEEDARYNRKQLAFRYPSAKNDRSAELSHSWDSLARQILSRCERNRPFQRLLDLPDLDGIHLRSESLGRYLPERLEIYRARLLDRAHIGDELMQQALRDRGNWLSDRLNREFMKDSLQRRQELFQYRAYDRTVHPTQMYSLQAEIALDRIVDRLISREAIPESLLDVAGFELTNEYLGRNVSITSQHEADEILLDLNALIAGEEYTALFTGTTLDTVLSFWSDWDGSNRPSGQGHSLAAAIVIENVRRMAQILDLLVKADPGISVSPDLISELDLLPKRNQSFTRLLQAITLLTQQLEQRYRGVLPFPVEITHLQRLATRIHLRRDPVRVLWQHNDRYERKMLQLRRQRRQMLEYYFSLNKQLRKQLHALIPDILDNLSSEQLLRKVAGYRDLLQRAVITPRIHEGLITSRDQFAIDTTAYNMVEINTLTGKYGNPGMILALQVSLSAKPEALISLDRKLRMQGEQMRRENPSVELPPVRLIPLFENIDAVKSIRTYLDRVWDYATQSRNTSQSSQERFAEIVSEIFIAGSDLSQQISQAAGRSSYLQAKYDVHSWLAEHRATEAVRIKLGSGESMQRQGGYYSQVAGQPSFLDTGDNKRRFSIHLPAATRKSTAYAVTPLHGVFLGGDLRTFQSNLSEQLRFLPVRDYANLLYHVRETQRYHRNDLVRAAETIAESRLGTISRGVQELERLTLGTRETLYEEFLDELTGNFRHILYGRQEDVVGIHIISYFIGRSIPQLRDRPTSRRTAGTGSRRGQQILANIAEIIPLAKQGSLLRAISHNQAQTVVLGINQLTTGLFRALERYSQKAFAEADCERMITERLLPNLPVYEILNSLRIYQDVEGVFLKRIETAFPAGNSAFVALREDSDTMGQYLPLMQQELLRRHGVDVNDFFNNGEFIPELLPTLRPDLAVLLQKNLFNTDLDLLLEHVNGKIDADWRTEVSRLLELPRKIQSWRSVIWDVVGESIYQRVQSFCEISAALYSFSATRSLEALPEIAQGAKLPSALAGFFRTARPDDEMRNFLIGAIEYLSAFAAENMEVPVSIIHVMNDVQRIAQLEESALPPVKQDVIRFCVLQIARLAGENG